MMIDKRPALLLRHLIKVKNATMNQVIDSTRLTKRQISYDLDKVNQWLKERALPAISYRGIHSIVVPEEVVTYFRNQQMNDKVNDFVLTEKERLTVMYLYLFIREEPVSSVHLTQLLQVSKNTVISDVKKANELNRLFLVEIRYSRQKGYHLRGTESDKRVLVQHHLAQMINGPYFKERIHYLLRDQNERIHFEQIQHTLTQLERLFNLHFVEDRLQPFAYFLLFYFYRHRERKFVLFHQDEIELFQQDHMWQVAKTLFERLHFDQKEDELCYFTIQLLGLSLGSSSASGGDKGDLFKLCEQLVFDFENKAAIVFEKKDEVIHTLYQHFKPAYFRMKYRIPINNPLLDQIKSEHKELYTIVQELLQPIGTLLSITIPEEEIGFITIHFGALLEKPNQILPKRKRAFVVCPSGISSSLMVKHMLESLFTEIKVEKTLSLQGFRKENLDHYDLLFATVELESKLPCFTVRPIMTPTEKNNLVNEVYLRIFGIHYQDLSLNEVIQTIKRYANVYDEKGLTQALRQLTFQRKVEDARRNQPVLSDLLKKETVQILEQLPDWEEAVKAVAQPLLVTGSIEDSYIDAMITNIKTLGPYVVIGPEVAIPHARPESGVNQVGMSFLKLNKPVYFLDDEKYPVRLLFCIAAIDNSAHLKALSQLTKLLSENNNINLLKGLQSTEEILALFKHYSSGG